jgi:signal transduction histidine kinase
MHLLARLAPRLSALERILDSRIPENLLADEESLRRARLITRFGALGLVFGLIYMCFYLAIGHIWGAVIVSLCSIGVAASPSIMVARRAIGPAGHFFQFVLTLGFFSLCCVEGGVHGHALAWLTCIPLCALLLLGVRASGIWLAIAFLTATLVVGGEMAGLRLPSTYDPRWEPLVSAAGYLGLVVFMSALGLIFERGRSHAFRQLQDALHELSSTNQRLVSVNREKDEFLGIAAHDLKNPLTVIMASSEMIRLTPEKKQVDQMANKITLASERMHRLIKDLLDANAIEQGRYASSLETCGLRPLVEQIVEQNVIAAQRKKIEIRFGQGKDLNVRTDSAATLQILDNLLSNAVKYSPFDTTVHVHVVPEKEFALVIVRDEGPGLSEEDQTRLFQKFCRLSSRPTGGESSTGLGLSIAYRLAKTLGGDIQCRSTLGNGTTFILRLPLRPAVDPRAAQVHSVDDILREQKAYASALN